MPLGQKSKTQNKNNIVTNSIKTLKCGARLKNKNLGTFLVVQWLRVCASNAGDERLIPGQGAKIPHTIRSKNRNKYFFTKDTEMNLTMFLPSTAFRLLGEEL